MYVYMNVCMYVGRTVCMNVCMNVCSICFGIYVIYLYVCECLCYMCVLVSMVYVCMYVCMYLRCQVVSLYSDKLIAKSETKLLGRAVHFQGGGPGRPTGLLQAGDAVYVCMYCMCMYVCMYVQGVAFYYHMNFKCYCMC
jgi:hypothetical protein